MPEEVEFLLHFEIMSYFPNGNVREREVCWRWFAVYNTEKSKKYSKYLALGQA